MKYIREFIDLKQDATGFNFSGSKVSGHCKYEVIHGKAKLKLTLNNLRPSAGPYTVNVVKCDGDNNVAVQLGSLDVSTDGRSQFTYSKQLTDSKDSEVLKDFDVLMVRIEDHSRDIITPAIGYRRETLLWRQNFHYFNEDIDLKKFGVHIDDVIHGEKMEPSCGCSNNQKDIETIENVVVEEPEETIVAEPADVKEDIMEQEAEEIIVADPDDMKEEVMEQESEEIIVAEPDDVKEDVMEQEQEEIMVTEPDSMKEDVMEQKPEEIIVDEPDSVKEEVMEQELEEIKVTDPDDEKEEVMIQESEEIMVTETLEVEDSVMDEEEVEDDTTPESQVVADGIPTEENEDVNDDEPMPVTPEPEEEPNIFIDTEDDKIIEVGSENERSKPVESFEEGLRQLQESIEKEFRSIQSSYGFEQEQSEDVTVDYVDYDDHCIHKEPKTMSKEQEQLNKDFLQGTMEKEEESIKEEVKVDEPDEEPKEETMETVTEESIEEENVQSNTETTEAMEEEVKDEAMEEKDEAKEVLDPVEEILRSEGVKRFSRKADDMFNTYPRLSPFEKQGEQEHWIRIEPRDIAIFPINTWRFMNNPFLINGYYKHHHILLGERLTKEKHQVYTLAVPAQYNGKQKHIANAHGFDFFRSCRNTEAKTGEFGYWMKEIHAHPSRK